MIKTIIYLMTIILVSSVLFLLTKELLIKESDDKQVIEPPIINPPQRDPKEQFEDCMREKNSIVEKKLFIELETLNTNFNKYNISVLYNNLLDGYEIRHNEKENYYSASTVKPAVALYYYTMASEGFIDLDEQVVFSEKFWNETIRKRIGLNELVSLRTLLKYSMTYSDNGAHKLLVEKIGYKKLNDFIKEVISPENVFFPNDVYGRINAVDGTLLIKQVYKFIKENNELGQELKNYMINSSLRTLSLDGLEIAQKYGWWEEDFHVLGIVYDQYPYTLVVLTKHGENKEYFSVIDNVNKKIAQFHSKYIIEKEVFCSNAIITE